ncbi:MAG: hypothetical protein CL693_07025 [Cellvibrionaceae bacterium]|nr:hypothetical protein [Cellvibrionaceae bacterium]|tara:strand:+ start:24904 stop:26736 length:1833 start_codon:yes stop_codon:yes gene_type:complete
MIPSIWSQAGVLATALLALNNVAAVAQERNLYWGDTHLHTAHSMDAYFFQNSTATPDVAYRYAKGLPVINAANRTRIRINTPLDFLVVADHAEYMTVPLRLFSRKEKSLVDTEFGQRLVSLFNDGKQRQAALELVGTVNDNKPYAPFLTDKVRTSAWALQIDAAEKYNEPGKFSAIIGWEWTSFPNASNLHRVVFTRDGADKANQFVPYSALDSSDPEDLWRWMGETEQKTGAKLVAIPHNGNVSNGMMFSRNDFKGDPITESYAKTRMRWEPLYEVTQIKGDSETHPKLSPDDEFADFSTYDHLLDAAAAARGEEVRSTVKEGDYGRRALRTGLELEATLGTNPFKVGFIGSTDSHSGMASAEEDNFWGKFAYDSTPENRRQGILPGTDDMFGMSAAGLAAVWAEENTRESLFEAFMRKEVYATSGPRIQLRFFGGFKFKQRDAKAKDIGKVGYKKGVPMGGDLTRSNKAPSFLIHSVKDPDSGNLDRVQVVKGWLDSQGQSHEKIYNVAWSDERKLKSDGRLPAVGNTVDLETGTYTNSIGATQLSAVWRDPDFDASQSAFYYTRVLEIPTPRYSMWDAMALGVDNKETGQPATHQERAYSSPIWYTP